MHKDKKLLEDVVILRPLAIVMLALFHAFAPYGGGWGETPGFKEIGFYKWFDFTVYSFMLELFVLMSGYVFAYQLFILKRTMTWKSLIGSKLKRLILPGLVFSFFSFVCYDKFTGKSVSDITLTIIDGHGHIWFLPMLFWCFIEGFALSKLKWPEWLKLAICLCVVFIPRILPHCFRIHESFKYIFFFYGGMVLLKNRERLISAITPRRIVILGILFIFTFIPLRYLAEYPVSLFGGVTDKVLNFAIKNGGRMIYASLGCFLAWSIVNKLLRDGTKVPTWVFKLNAVCFGIYLFQQFFFMSIYYNTNFPTIVGPYWLPWIGFAIAFIGSWFLATLTRKSKIGRFLIG